MNRHRFLQRSLPCLGVILGGVLWAGPRLAADERTVPKTSWSGSALGLDLFRLFAARDGNIVFSPYSVSETIAVLSAGANGATRDELLRALHWDQAPEALAGAFKAQDAHLVPSAGDGATLLVANGLWYQEENLPRQAFVETAKADFDAEVRGADFEHDPLDAEREINAWVGLKTKGKIPDLLPAESLNERTRIALVNAVYFKGKWEHPFKEGSTEPRPFFLSPSASVMVPQMSERETLRSASTPLCDLLELPYEDGRISMVVLLPRTREGLPLLEKSLGQAALLEWLAALDFSSPMRIHVTLPRFRMTYAAELNQPLRSLGVTTAFSPGTADFSGIDGRRDLHLSTVLHKAFINVDEEGTEAAAATFAGVATLAVERAEEFRVDHPFLFLIRDNASGSLLFLGRVSDPRVQ